MTEDSKESLPAPIKKQPQLRRHVEARLEAYSGPLPKPSDLQEYDNVVPGAGERIIRMAEQQAEHRQFLEKTVITGDTKRADMGLYSGAVIAFCVLGGSIFLIYTGHDWAGAFILSLDIVGLVSVFIYGTRSRRSERAEKATIMKQPNTSLDT